MAMNEVNPLSFIRRVIPDTAAKTNAETFKQKAALGLQNNKQAAAMAKALQEISGREKVSRLANSIPLSAKGEGLDAILQGRNDVNRGKDIAKTLADMKSGNIQSLLPSGSTMAQMANPDGRVVHRLDPLVKQAIQLGNNSMQQNRSKENTVEYTDFNPDAKRYEKYKDTQKKGTKNTQKRPVQLNVIPPSAEPSLPNVQKAQSQQPQQATKPVGLSMPAAAFDGGLEDGTVKLDPNGSGRYFTDNGDGTATIVIRGQ